MHLSLKIPLSMELVMGIVNTHHVNKTKVLILREKISISKNENI